MIIKNIAKSWGPCTWYYLHYLALNYNPKLKQNYISLIKFFKWTIIIHNDINRRNYKRTYNVEDAKKLYQNYNKNKILNFLKNFCSSNFNNNRFFLIKLLNEVINTYPNNNVREKLINFRKNCKIKNRNIEWFYVYFNVIKNN